MIFLERVGVWGVCHILRNLKWNLRHNLKISGFVNDPLLLPFWYYPPHPSPPPKGIRLRTG